MRGTYPKAILVAVAMILSSIVGLSTMSENVDAALPSHAPIIISNDAGFNATNGVSNGTGSSTYPYIIENWDINAAIANGIEIRDTNSYYIIRNVIVHSGGSTYSGIVLNNSLHGRITASNISDIRIGISVYSSSLVTLDDNHISGSRKNGIYLSNCDNSTVIGNNDSLNAGSALTNCGIYFRYSDNITVQGNDVVSNSWDGINVGFSKHSSVSGNTILLTQYTGIWLDHCTGFTVSSNIVNSNGGSGIVFWSETNTIVVGNNVQANSGPYGLDLVSSTSITVYHNNFIGSSSSVHDDSGSENSWDNGYSTGGNYWSSYAGTDTMNGPAQNIPGADGIGDTPRVIDGNSQDNYPLMTKVPINEPPTANFIVVPAYGNTTIIFTFNASSSSDPQDPATSLQVRWDWENDGTWDTGRSTDKVAYHQYLSQGIYTVKLEVNDTGGLNDTTTEQLIVDDIAPIANSTITGTLGSGGWYRSNVNITLSSSDSLSGVSQTLYKIDTEIWQNYSGTFAITANGNHTILYYSVDNSKNTELIKSVSFGIDKIACELIPIYPVDGQIISNQTQAFAVYFNDAEPSSGIANSSILALVDSTILPNATIILDNFILIDYSLMLSEGWHLLSIYAEDNAGNLATLGVGFYVSSSISPGGPNASLLSILTKIYDWINTTEIDLNNRMSSLENASQAMQQQLNDANTTIQQLLTLLNSSNETLNSQRQELSEMNENNSQLKQSLEDIFAELNSTKESANNAYDAASSANTFSLLAMLIGIILIVLVIVDILMMRRKS